MKEGQTSEFELIWWPEMFSTSRLQCARETNFAILCFQSGVLKTQASILVSKFELKIELYRAPSDIHVRGIHIQVVVGHHCTFNTNTSYLLATIVQFRIHQNRWIKIQRLICTGLTSSWRKMFTNTSRKVLINKRKQHTEGWEFEFNVGVTFFLPFSTQNSLSWLEPNYYVFVYALSFR